MDSKQAGHSDALFHEVLAHPVSGSLGGDHHHVHRRRRHHELVVDGEAVGEHQGFARPQVGLDLIPVHVLLHVVGDGYHHHFGLLGDLSDAADLQAGVAGDLSAGAAFIQAHHNLHAAVVEV